MLRRWLSVAAFSLILGCGGAGFQGKKGSQAPDFSIVTLEGRKVTLSDYYQKSSVLLIFWATWCPTCVEEIPELNQLSQKYPSEKLQILAVNVQESPSDIKKFLSRNPVKYPILMDEEGETAAKYDIAGLPVSVFLAKGGEILYYGFSIPRDIENLLVKQGA